MVSALARKCTVVAVCNVEKPQYKPFVQSEPGVERNCEFLPVSTIVSNGVMFSINVHVRIRIAVLNLLLTH